MGDEESPPPPGDGAEDHPNGASQGDEQNGDAEVAIAVAAPAPNDNGDPPPPPADDARAAPAKRNINSYYGHKVGFLQTLSLTLNAGLMVYAHVGLSAVIFSSQDPSATDSLNAASEGAPTAPAENSTAAGINGTAAIGGGRCNPQDLELWMANGGEETRPVHSNFCSREYNNGCFLDGGCIETCFAETYGYSQECSSCFAEIPSCSVSNGCTMACAADSFSEECKQCNAPCIEELRLCTGLPEVKKADVAQGSGQCDANDVEIWIVNGGEASRPEQSNFCSREYNNGCFLDEGCIERCFQETYGYSEECSECFSAIPMCSVGKGCTLLCAADSFSPECKECNIPCVEELGLCTGLGEVDGNATLPVNETDKNTTLPPNAAIGNTCNEFDLEAIDKWYNVYDLTFIKSIQDAWNGDAKLLAVIIVIFSGIWPYLKNIILVIIWYTPASVETQTATLLWLSRLSKYTLVDVFAVIGVLVGVQLQLNIGGTEAVTRGEPRFGIIAFFLATVWEFLQIELIKAMHERKVLGGKEPEGEARLMFSKLWIPVLILAASLALYISGAIAEIVYFESTDTAGVCNKSYNIVTLGNALVNDLSMTSNSAPGQTWILYLSYVVLNLAFPVITHLMQLCFIAGWFRSVKLKRLIDWTLAIWCFACIEVLLIGVFAVEYKFPNLIMKIAGDTNAGFLNIDSQLGPGFYVLIAYSVVAGFLQASLRIRHDKPAKSTSQDAEMG